MTDEGREGRETRVMEGRRGEGKRGRVSYLLKKRGDGEGREEARKERKESEAQGERK